MVFLLKAFRSFISRIQQLCAVTQEILSTVNLGLDVVLKSLAILLLAYGVYLLKRLDEVMQEAEESVESVEEAADEAASLRSLGKKIPLLGGSK